MSRSIMREHLPLPDVFIEKDDKSLEPASSDLACDVLEDIDQVRIRIENTFGLDDEWFLPPQYRDKLVNFFVDNKWSIPKIFSINPTKDTKKLNQILSTAKFPDEEGINFFTGANGQRVSPGGNPQYDFVILHDMHGRHSDEIIELVTQDWEYSISNDELERLTNLKAAEFACHELSHLAGSLAVSAIVIKKMATGYALIERATAGFVDLSHGVVVAEEGEDYYAGPALDEGWASMVSSMFISSLLGYSRDEADIADRYYIPGEISDGSEKFYTNIAGFHSGMAGMVIEGLDKNYPGIVSTMMETCNGTRTTSDALKAMSSMVPATTMELLVDPSYSSWEKLYSITYPETVDQ